MDATTDIIPAAPHKNYKSRSGALAWFFEKSRDNWKGKHQALKVSVKGLKNQLAAVTRSRAQWRAQAELASQRVAALETELAALRSRDIAIPSKKKRPAAR